MFKTTVNYKDFNDKPHTEDLYFHMMAPEFADLEFNPTFEGGGGFGDYVRDAMKSGDGQKIYTFFKLMIVNSYGKRSDDGARFAKKAEWTEDFLNSNAYEEFFMWLITDHKNADKFWNGIMPEKLAKTVEEIENAQASEDGENTKKKHVKDMTREELLVLMQQRLDTKRDAIEA